MSAKIYVTCTTFVRYVNWPSIIIENNITATPLSSSSSSLPRTTIIIIKSKDLYNVTTYLVFFRCYIEIKSFPQSRFSSRRFSIITSSKWNFYRKFQLSFARYLLNYTGIYWKDKVHFVLL